MKFAEILPLRISLLGSFTYGDILGTPRMNLFRRYRLQHCHRALRHLGYDVELRIDQFSHFDLHHCSQQQRNLAVRKTIVTFNPCRKLRR